jgi:outer membrane protein
VQWYPKVSDKIHPYVGAGVNHTFFFEDDTSAGELNLSSSTSWAVEAGMDIDLTNKLVLKLGRMENRHQHRCHLRRRTCGRA